MFRSADLVVRFSRLGVVTPGFIALAVFALGVVEWAASASAICPLGRYDAIDEDDEEAHAFYHHTRHGG